MTSKKITYSKGLEMAVIISLQCEHIVDAVTLGLRIKRQRTDITQLTKPSSKWKLQEKQTKAS